jgi:hypothetical protein
LIGTGSIDREVDLEIYVNMRIVMCTTSMGISARTASCRLLRLEPPAVSSVTPHKST